MPKEIDSPTVIRIRGNRVQIPLVIAGDLSGYTAKAQLRDQDGNGTLLAEFITTITPSTDRTSILLVLTDSEDLPLTDDLAFDVLLTHETQNTLRTARIWLQMIQGVTAE